MAIAEGSAILAGALIGGATSMAGAGFQAGGNKKQRKWQEKMYQKQQNFAVENWNRQTSWQEQMRQAQWDYQDAWTKRTWARDDNQVQRKVKDLQMAGLSPTLALGGGGASSAPVANTSSASASPGSASVPGGGESGLSSFGRSLQNAHLGSVAQDALMKREQIELMKIQQTSNMIDTLSKMRDMEIDTGRPGQKSTEKPSLPKKMINETVNAISNLTTTLSGSTLEKAKKMKSEIDKRWNKVRKGTKSGNK